MSRRNLILLIVVLAVITVIFLLIYSATRPAGEPGDRGGFFSNLNPFGDRSPAAPYGTPATDEPGGEYQTPPSESEKRKLQKLSTVPVAGYGLFEKEIAEREFAPGVKYVDRETGNIYQTMLDDIKERRFSSTVIPKVYEAYFEDNARSVIMRYLRKDNLTIETFWAVLPQERLGEDTVDAYEIRGSYLPVNIPDVALSPEKGRLFYLLPAGEGISGIALNLKDGKKTQVFSSNFTEWLPLWPGNNFVSLTTKASGNALGYVYGLDVSRKRFERLTPGSLGLTSLSSSGGRKLLIADSSLNLSLYDTATKESRSLGVRTLPEKCIWTKSDVIVYCAVPKVVSAAIYPDAWYQGEVQWNDEIWRINTSEGTTSMIADLGVLAETDIEAIKPGLDKEENTLFFVNRKDSTLWSLDLRD